MAVPFRAEVMLGRMLGQGLAQAKEKQAEGASDATRNLVYARGMPEGQGKILIATNAPLALIAEKARRKPIEER
jgi:hypothetical protein